MKNFKKIAERYEHPARVETRVLELSDGHTVTREDHISTLGAGHKGRAARIDVYREYKCSCGGECRSYGGPIADDMATLPHFDSPEAAVAYYAEMKAKADEITKALGL